VTNRAAAEDHRVVDEPTNRLGRRDGSAIAGALFRNEQDDRKKCMFYPFEQDSAAGLSLERICACDPSSLSSNNDNDRIANKCNQRSCAQELFISKHLPFVTRRKKRCNSCVASTQCGSYRRDLSSQAEVGNLQRFSAFRSSAMDFAP